MMATLEAINAIIAVAAIGLISLIAAPSLRRRLRSKRVDDAPRRWPCSDLENKPQNRFKHVLADNSYTKPFEHLKRDRGDSETASIAHPYECEISELLSHPPALADLAMSAERPRMGGSYVWVDTEEQLKSLAALLSEERVFGVDTEQHSLRSFLGFTALMQISTREEDFLVDTIALHDVMAILRPVFSNPSICKVFHGADNDVLWLQRDFHLYVVNMFDTAKACDVLSKPQKSLAYLLENYCGVSTNKILQREDWRIRPLSPEMIHYARTDAHYLLYIADCLLSELRMEVHDTSACPDDKFNFFSEASRRSNTVCMQVYTKERESSPGASAAASLYARNFNLHGGSLDECLEIKDRIWRLCAWRDIMARIHDESAWYILSDQAIAALAAKDPLDAQEIYEMISEADLSNCFSNVHSSLQSPSPVVSTHMDEICCLLQEMNENVNDIFQRCVQKHLGPSGCCLVSFYNNSLLSEFSNLSLSQPGALFLKQNRGNCTPLGGKKLSRELFVQKFSCKSPVYHNCRIYANDGRLLCFCDRRKLEWYIRRDLAKIVENDPPAIMLLFEPKGRPEDEDNDFYIQSKKNICVGCGEKSHYLRYRIIPSCYRMHFPEHLKSHRSHDIVLLCVDCHEVAHSAAEKYKKQIAVEYGIPLFVQKIADCGVDAVSEVTGKSEDTIQGTGVSPLQLRTAAMALLRHGSNMPWKRRDELIQIVKAYFGGREVSPEDLERALLVGMSPHEKRRLEKKRGLSFKHLDVNASSKISKCSALNTNEGDGKMIDSSGMSQGSSQSRCVEIVDAAHQDTSVDANAELLPSEEICLIESDNQKSNEELLAQRSGSTEGDSTQNGDSPHETSETCHPSRSHRAPSSKSSKKVSLLGHGPHGKQVVEYLLDNPGEDGIREFCQRWRQVFVEAIHPRFLPSGWDVRHSGRREFGDYSVYNPAKRIPYPHTDS